LKGGKFSTPRGPCCLLTFSQVDEWDEIIIQDPITCVALGSGSYKTSLTKIALPQYIASAQVVTVRNFLYVLGGMDNKELSSNKVYRYDTLTKNWLEMAPMNLARANHAAVAVQHNIIVIGGFPGVNIKPIESVEKYDIGENKWITVKDFPHLICGSAACEYKNNVYVSGGYDFRNIFVSLDKIYQYDMVGDVWLLVGRMSEARDRHMMCKGDKGLYIIGGFYWDEDETGCRYTCEYFDVESKTTTSIANIPVGCEGHGAVVYGESIYVPNECDDTGTVYRYDMNADTWSKHPTTLPRGIAGCAGGVLLTVPYKEFV